MHAIQALMNELVDYAGLFPPASLEMEPTVRNYAGYRESHAAPMLGRLIVPVSRFEEFDRAAADLLPPVPDAESADEDPDPWVISALVSSAADVEAVERDLEAIDAFNDRHASEGGGAAIVDTIELAAPDGDSIDAVLDLLDDDIYPYFELDWRNDVRGSIAAIAGLDAAAKIRTGGVTADAHPGVEPLAAFIEACRNAEVPFKATAGLHHPVRAEQASVGAKQFGFLNVFLGALLFHAGRIDGAGLRDVLAEEDPAAFIADNNTMGWRMSRVGVPEILEIRSRFAHAFGSCSFTEPLDDLVTLGLLDAAGTSTLESTDDGDGSK